MDADVGLFTRARSKVPLMDEGAVGIAILVAIILVASIGVPLEVPPSYSSFGEGGGPCQPLLF